jgi:hypothetical protein
MASDIKIRTLIGPGIKTYIQSIAKLRQQVMSEIPYLQLGGPETDLKYLKHISMSKDAIAVLVFDGPKIIGASTGTPLSEELPVFQEPFIQQRLPVDDYYYFGFSALLKPYRGRGIAHHFFDLREEHVRHLKRFTKICFTSMITPKGHVRPATETSLETFWQKRGYIQHPKMTCRYPILDHHFAISMKFWIKELQPAAVPHLDQLDSYIYE